ncbi:MAG: hypothetical protein A2Z72_06240 [Omnitrophica bacterium RBG_13_46_9]|nr:MAG: hypothetical protein A2Z72_06240 [Omnitrophica bacterium RBG_13_46_9]
MSFRRKEILFWLILLIFILGSAESICFVAFKTFKKRFTFLNFKKYVTDGSYIKYASQKYHPERGWDNLYPTKFGERPRSIDYNESLISVFGDSNVHCDEVNHDETWEEYLSALLQKNVYNFGSGGYGADQTYLKFLSIFPEARTPIVVLGFPMESINRIVSVYRPFYYENTGLRLTKPRFFLKQDGGLSFLPNPVHSLDEVKNLNNPYFLNLIGRYDYWFNRDRYPTFMFPYTKILFNKRVWLEIVYGKGRSEIDDVNPRPSENLWKDTETAELMFNILKSFAVRSKDLDAIPIIMIFPTENEVKNKFSYGRGSIAEEKISLFCQQNNILLFNSVEVLAQNASSVAEIKSFFKGHLSVKGNQAIARYFHDFLKNYVLEN